MIIFDQEQLDLLLDRFAGGFGVTPLHFALFFVVLFMIAAFLIVSYRIIDRREQRRLEERIGERNRMAFDRFKISEAEDALLRDLSQYLRDPRKVYLLLTDANTFSTALQAAGRAGSIDRESVRSLQKKLGIDPRTQLKAVKSTADLPEGLSVVVEWSKELRRSGIVRSQDEHGISVELKKPVERRDARGEVTIYFYDRRGIFAVATECDEAQGATVRLRHSNRLRRAQRRTYARRLIDDEVVVRLPEQSGGEGQSYSTELIDLSGGGASCRNPDRRLREGDDIVLYLTRGRDDWMPVPGEVVRLSRGGTTAHIRFGHIDESTRDRIIRIVQAPS